MRFRVLLDACDQFMEMVNGEAATRCDGDMGCVFRDAGAPSGEGVVVGQPRHLVAIDPDAANARRRSAERKDDVLVVPKAELLVPSNVLKGVVLFVIKPSGLASCHAAGSHPHWIELSKAEDPIVALSRTP